MCERVIYSRNRYELKLTWSWESRKLVDIRNENEGEFIYFGRRVGDIPRKF